MSHVEEYKDDLLREWVGVRQFLWQRRRLLGNPSLTLWIGRRQAWAFAIQGTVVVGLLIATTGWVIAHFTPLTTESQGIESVEAERLRKRIEKTNSFVAPLQPPMSLGAILIAASVFARTTRPRAKERPRLKAAHSIYLGYVTARMFFPSLTIVACLFAMQLTEHARQLENWIGLYVFLMAALGCWALIVFLRVTKELLPVIEWPEETPLSGRWYIGLRLVCSQVSASIVLSLAFYGLWLAYFGLVSGRLIGG